MLLNCCCNNIHSTEIYSTHTNTVNDPVTWWGENNMHPVFHQAILQPMKLGLWHHLQNVTMAQPWCDSPIQPLSHTEKLCHTLGVPLIWWATIIFVHCSMAATVYILSESHPVTMSAILIAQIFLLQYVQRMHGATCYTMGDHNIHTLLHGVFDWSYLYSEGKRKH